MPISDNFIQELKLRCDIEDIVSTYVTLKRRGRTLVGLCPFHNEKTPSFTVYPESQSFYCFGCGAGGDAIGFIKRIENLDYVDSVKVLAQRNGLQMPEDKAYDNSLGKMRRRILEVNRTTAKFYHNYMLTNEGRKGLDYFLSRGLKPKTITKFGLGYAPDEWTKLYDYLCQEGFTDSEMLAAGVVKRSKKGRIYDAFKNRVMTPIIDIRGNVIAFGGRVLDDSKPKYINTGETLVYKKTYELFGMNIAKDNTDKGLILCEGYMDVIAMHQAGFTNAVAGCGTALTNEQVKVISRYADEVILCYDNDDAGRKALNKAIGLFRNTNVKIRIPALTGGKDPDEIIKKEGVEKFSAMLESSSNDIEYALINARSGFLLSSTQGKVDYLNEAIKILADTSPIEQDLYVSRLSEELGVSKESIMASLKDHIKRNNRYKNRRSMNNKVSESMRSIRKESYDTSASPRKIKAQDRLIGLLIKYPQCRKLCDGFDDNLLSEGFFRKIYQLTVDFIDRGLDTDLMNYSAHLSDSELGRLSGIIARFSKSVNVKDEFSDCIKVISEESDENNSKNVKNLTDEEFRRLFSNT